MICDKDPIWYFDATGGIFKKILHQQETLIYSIVIHDSLNNKCLSIADFFTNSNNNVSIFTYFHVILEKFKCYNFFKLPKAVVTDFSWANIVSLMKAVNNIDVIDYLNLAFQVIVENQKFSLTAIKSMIYLCSTHFLKNIQIDTKNALKNVGSEKAKKFYNLFIGAFCVLQNSICINVFNQILKSLKIVFTSKIKNELFEINYLIVRAFILNNSVEIVDHSCSNCKTMEKIKENDEKKIIFIENNDVSYVKDSPFTKYFNDLLNFQLDTIGSTKNKYFMPKLFELITKKLHLMPFWSGVMLKHFNINQSRLSNNFVEKRFQDLKINLLRKHKRVNKFQRLTPNEFITPNYFNIQSEYKSIYEDKFNIQFYDFESKRDNFQTDRYTYEKWSLPLKLKKADFIKKKNFETNEKNHLSDLIKKIKLVDFGLYEEMEWESETEIHDDFLEKKETRVEDSDNKIDIELMETNDAFNSDEIYESGTNVENFFYYKINNILVRKKDIKRLLNNEWLSENVKRSILN